MPKMLETTFSESARRRIQSGMETDYVVSIPVDASNAPNEIKSLKDLKFEMCLRFKVAEKDCPTDEKEWSILKCAVMSVASTTAAQAAVFVLKEIVSFAELMNESEQAEKH